MIWKTNLFVPKKWHRTTKPYAYKLIRQLNEELKEKGFITITGRVNRQYFYERLYGAGKEEK